MSPVPNHLQQIPPLQNNVAVIEPWHVDEMSVLERQRKSVNELIAEHANPADESESSTKSLGKRGILDEEELEWYFDDDDLADEISELLVKRGNVKDKTKDAVEQATDKVKDTIDDADSKIKDAVDNAAERADMAGDKAGKVSGHVKDGVSDAGSAASDAKDAILDTIKNVKDEIKKSNRRK